MTTRQIEWVEEPFVRLESGDKFPGDRNTLPKAEADQYIDLGWAKCVETGEIGERKPGAVALKVDSVEQKLG
ncbi:MAG: hypothetical protein AB9Q22_10290 [Candidatus Reddybacter sp.]